MSDDVTLRLTKEQQKEVFEGLLAEETEKLRRKSKGYKVMSDAELRPLAKHNLQIEYETLVRQMAEQSRESQRLTVGCLYGKTRAQILKEQEEEG